MQPLPHAVVHGVGGWLDAAEVAGEGDVEAVVVALVLHQQAAGREVEAREGALVQVAVEGVVQHEPLVECHWYPLVAKRGEEALEHVV